MNPMTPRERFHAVTNFQPFDQLPRVEWAFWWNKTIERWQSEGLPVTDRYDLFRHFGLDLYYQDWCMPNLPPPVTHGAPIASTHKEYDELRKRGIHLTQVASTGCVFPQRCVGTSRGLPPQTAP
jgi:hypothetical protein